MTAWKILESEVTTRWRRYDRKSSFESGERPEGEERCWVERKGRGQAWNQGCFGESKKLKEHERTVERSFQMKSELSKWKVKSQKTAEWQRWELNGCGHWVWNVSSWLCDKKASQDSCFARTHGRRGARTAVNGIPYLLTVRAFCAEKDCDLFSSCSLPSKNE